MREKHRHREIERKREEQRVRDREIDRYAQARIAHIVRKNKKKKTGDNR